MFLKINFLMRCFFSKLTKILKQSAILHFIISGLVFLFLPELFEKLRIYRNNQFTMDENNFL